MTVSTNTPRTPAFAAAPGGASQLTPGQNAFIAAIEAQVDSLLGTQLDGNFTVVNAPQGFNYGITSGNAGNYNKATLDAVNSLIGPASNGIMTLTGGALSTTYFQILSAASYQYSRADNAVINSPNVASQQQAILAAARSDGYTITDSYTGVVLDAVKTYAAGATTVTPTTLSLAAKNMLGLYPDLSAALANSANQMAPQLAIMNTQFVANSRLTAAQGNSQNPTLANGGLPTGATAFSVGFAPLPTGNQILGGLEGTSKISISITAQNFSSHEAHFSISGGASFSVPILDFLSFGFGGSASYSVDRYTSSASSLTMTMEYDGIYVFSTKPSDLSADNSTGWYANDLLASIVAGSGDDSISGFKIPTSSQYNITDTFGPGKTFSRLKTFVISQAPTITLTFSAAESDTLIKDFQENASLSVKLFGLFDIGSVSESYKVHDVQSNSAAGTVTIKLGPPNIQGTVPLDKQVAYIIGGVASYPPNNI